MLNENKNSPLMNIFCMVHLEQTLHVISPYVGRPSILWLPCPICLAHEGIFVISFRFTCNTSLIDLLLFKSVYEAEKQCELDKAQEIEVAEW